MASRATGGCFLVLLGIGAAAVFIAVAPIAGTLTLWSVSAVWLWWAVDDSRRRPEKYLPDTPDPAPPPEEDPSPDAKPLVKRIEKDPDHLTRYNVVWVPEKENES